RAASASSISAVGHQALASSLRSVISPRKRRAGERTVRSVFPLTSALPGLRSSVERVERALPEEPNGDAERPDPRELDGDSIDPCASILAGSAPRSGEIRASRTPQRSTLATVDRGEGVELEARSDARPRLHLDED